MSYELLVYSCITHVGNICTTSMGIDYYLRIDGIFQLLLCFYHDEKEERKITFSKLFQEKTNPGVYLFQFLLHYYIDKNILTL